MYLDYAAVLPYTGGELVYVSPRLLQLSTKSNSLQLDEITAVSTPPEISDPEQRSPSGSVSSIAPPSQSQNNQKKLLHRVFGDGLLAYVVYSLLFIGIFNSGTNSMQTGRMILLCIQAGPGQSAPDLNRDLIRFIGVVTLTILCLIQYFSAEAGRKLNRYLAVLKIIFLFILIVAGGVKAREVQRDTKGNPVDMANEWHRSYDVKSKVNFAKGLLAVLFSFEGWENATFVSREVLQ
jgi:amino acid transporter